MLTSTQARQIVHDSIRKALKTAVSSDEQALRDVGVQSDESIRSLVMTIAADADVGVPSRQHYVDVNGLADLDPALTVGGLTQRVCQLSTGKLCSNPQTPHAQTWPYPTRCPQCNYPVP